MTNCFAFRRILFNVSFFYYRTFLPEKDKVYETKTVLLQKQNIWETVCIQDWDLLPPYVTRSKKIENNTKMSTGIEKKKLSTQFKQ